MVWYPMRIKNPVSTTHVRELFTGIKECTSVMLVVKGIDVMLLTVFILKRVSLLSLSLYPFFSLFLSLSFSSVLSFAVLLILILVINLIYEIKKIFTNHKPLSPIYSCVTLVINYVAQCVAIKLVEGSKNLVRAVGKDVRSILLKWSKLLHIRIID